MPLENKSSRRKRIVFALLAILLVPTVVLLLLEGGLRLASYGYPTTFFVERSINGEKFLVENDKFGWRFFPPELARSPSPMRIRREKVPGMTRIFVFGESAALGDPKPGYSMGRYLEVLLRRGVPDRKFEVITVAMTAINSHAILPIARECARLEGDYWIIYMGNNEMMGPFGANPLSGPAAPPIRQIRMSIALRGTRLGQLIENTAKRFAKPDGGEKAWQGMKTFLAHQVAPDAPKRSAVHENFRHNLHDIIDTALNSSARPVVCTVAGNLKDCAPFASIDGPQSAESQFRAGEAALAANDYAAARKAFVLARDSDALPFRTDSRMNEMIRDAGKKGGVLLADIEAAIADASEGGLPGDETFFDHVHFTFSGNYRVATMLAERIAAAMNVSTSNWPTANICDRELALTDWNRRAAVEHMLQRLSEPPFSNQLNHTRREESLARAIVEYRERSQDPQAIATARDTYTRAIAEHPSDFRLRENFAEFLESVGDVAPAVEQWREVAKLLPHQHSAFFQLGRLFARQKKHDDARNALLKALELRPDLAEAMVELGQIAFREGNHGAALERYAHAASLRPSDARLRILQADALAAQGNRGAGMEKLKEAVQLRPNHWEARYLLAIELAATNRFAEAITEFNEVTRLRPDYAQAHFNLGVAAAKAGQINEAIAAFRKALELDPTHRLAGNYLKALEPRLNKTE
jgi:tetratricopeptide (TPR) repeat protein